MDARHLLRQVFEKVLRDQIFGTILFGDGTAASPGWAFDGDADSGWYLNGTGEPALAAGGTQIAAFTTITETNDTMSLDPEADAENGTIEFTKGGTTYQIPIYDK